MQAAKIIKSRMKRYAFEAIAVQRLINEIRQHYPIKVYDSPEQIQRELDKNGYDPDSQNFTELCFPRHPRNV